MARLRQFKRKKAGIMRIVPVTNEGALFCGPACYSGFSADRRNHIMYGPVYDPETKGFYNSREAASRATGTCAYCGTKLREI